MKRFSHALFLIAIFALTACKGEAPKGESSAPPSTPAKTAQSLPKIVAFGDSLTAGYGLDPTASYPALLQEKLTAAGYAYEVVNAGVSGDTTAGGVRRIDWALEPGVKIVILELGANDILRGQPVGAMKQNLSQIMEHIQARGAKVLLAGMEAPTSSGIEYRKPVHEAFESLAASHHVDFLPFLLAGVAGIESLNQRDGIHPNEDGTKIVAENVFQALKPMLEAEKQKAAE
jgi:acyl-CoA thioesterase-1